jgi:hypothetical protein
MCCHSVACGTANRMQSPAPSFSAAHMTLWFAFTKSWQRDPDALTRGRVQKAVNTLDTVSLLCHLAASVFDLISDALPFGRLWYTKVSHAVGYAKFYRRSHHTVIRVYDEAGNVIATHSTRAISKSGENCLDVSPRQAATLSRPNNQIEFLRRSLYPFPALCDWTSNAARYLKPSASRFPY